jgi:hypothetical protein
MTIDPVDLKIFLFFFFGTLVFLWVSANVKKSLLQARREEFWREVVRRTEQRKKIDKLYGRDDESI